MHSNMLRMASAFSDKVVRQLPPQAKQSMLKQGPSPHTGYCAMKRELARLNACAFGSVRIRLPCNTRRGDVFAVIGTQSDEA